jgi:hypothetical protein
MPDSADLARPWWLHDPSHMKGWEAFGCTGQEPTVRRLGIVTFGPKGKGPATTEERPGTEPWGAGEVSKGVAGVHFSTHADDQKGGYLYVCGTEREDVEQRWREVDAAIRRWMPTFWPPGHRKRAKHNDGSGGAE